MKKIVFTFAVLLLTFISIDRVFADNNDNTCYKMVTKEGKVIYSYGKNLKNFKMSDMDLNKTEELSNDSRCKSILNDKVSCGNIGSFNRKIPEITSWIIVIIEILVPIILVIMGAIDFVKAIISSKDDEMRKAQQVFIKRLITAAIIFFIVAITKLIVSLVSNNSSESKNIINCIDCFISNKCS